MVVVGRFQPHGYLNGDAHRLLDGQSRLLLDIFLQRDTFYQLHHNIVDTTLFAHIIYIDDIRMHKSGRRLRLDPELGHEVGVFAEFLFQHLDRHKTVQLIVLGLIHI